MSPKAVTAIVWDFRGLDTYFETSVLFIAIAGLIALFGGAISIDPAKCWGCGACTLVCPPNALTMRLEGEKIVLEYFKGRCIFRGMCADTCPANAIIVTK
jgi:formate hydrogenlyase subunit 6/NADH:ubiquinone oxidoreductase subunit I